jgi:dihydroxyacetone kinase-like predicted kinase
VTAAKAEAREGDVALVVVSPGPGISRVFESLGASVIVPGGQTMNPSTEELLRAVEGGTADMAIILPNNANILLAARQVDGLTDKNVQVVGTRSVPQGISAALAFDYRADLWSNVEMLQQAVSHVQTIEVTRAIRSAQINGLNVEAGQAIALHDGELTANSSEINEVVKAALANIDAGEREIVTLYYGDNAAPEQAQTLLDELESIYPGLEFELIQGGQPHYLYIIGVE